MDLHQHVLEVRIWNSKDKLSARARFDRPKAFRLPAPVGMRTKTPVGAEAEAEGRKERTRPEEDDLTGRPARLPLVQTGSTQGAKLNKKRSKLLSKLQLAVTGADREDLNASVGEVTSPEPPVLAPGGSREQGHKVVGEAPAVADLNTSLVPFSKCPQLSSSLPTTALTGMCSVEHAQMPIRSFANLSFLLCATGLSRRRQKQLEAEAADQARIDREGIAVLRVRMSDLFAKRSTISAKVSPPHPLPLLSLLSCQSPPLAKIIGETSV